VAEKLKVIALGGLNEIGKNMYLYEYGNDIIVVDCGIGFPDDDMYGIDSVIPDISYLVKNRDRVRAFVLTHGHEDHIGAMPYVLSEVNAPVYCTALTGALVNIKLTERGMADKVKMNIVKAGETVKIGTNFKVEFIHVNHSIPDAVALALRTPVGIVIHTGDYKIDTTPIDGGMIDLARLGELGRKGVLALVSDSTNVETPGYSLSESVVAENFENQFKDCQQRIIVTTFASNVHRLQQVINCAKKYGRKVAVTGRSMENVLRVATELGYLDIPQGILVDINQTKGLPKDKVVIITTGSQGETMSALHRMAFSEHRQVEITSDDKIIISASAIPGNENSISRVIDELFRKGATVVYDRRNLHASGHACREELKLMLALIKPKYFIPVHGEYRHMKIHADVAKQMGVIPKNIVISDLGKVVEISGRSIKLNGVVPAGQVFVDGTGVGDVGSVVLRDRRHLAQDGMVVAVVTLSGEDGSIISGPDIITRGFVYVKEAEDLIEEMRDIALDAVLECYGRKNNRDWAAIKGTMKSRLSEYLYKKTKRSPMILPVIMEI